ncbi:MAG: HAD family hydrolase [Planctomycetota bacterium]
MIWVLFDIDGTLLQSHGLGRTAFNRAFEDVYSRPDALDGIELAGATDRLVIRRILIELLGREFTPAEYDALVTRFVARFVERMNGVVWNLGGKPLPAYEAHEVPGAAALVRSLARRPDVRLGLATGNLRVTAELKLALIGVRDCFDYTLGGYGDRVETREALLEEALAACAALPGPPPARRIYFGDTVKDIRAAHAHGMEVVGLRTHAEQGSQLVAAGAHHAIDDFRDLPGILAFLGLDD